jgi:iron(III) transport system substrate-binding protein
MLLRSRVTIALLLATLPFWTACTRAASPQQAATAAGSAAGQAPPRASWEEAVAAAQGEGKIVIHASAGVDLAQALTAGFQQRYPAVRVEYNGGGSSELIAKIRAEREAGQYLPDLFIHGTKPAVVGLLPMGALDPVRPFLVGAETRDESQWLRGQLAFSDDAQAYNLVYASGVKVPLGYNPQLVSPDEFRSFADLLAPKWRGKLAMYDPRLDGPGIGMATFFATNPELGREYLGKLFASGVVLSKDERQVLDWTARGQYPVTIAPSDRTVLELKRRGLPLEVLDPHL